ncbi:dihydrodipicolinate synthase family protein [Globicatella sanguinis]|uniref:dihydrodipicolinate synthase family protein n=1 Tax=Globicatella sanguinis TaxID=13076 RepID=UPI000C7AECD4|nr:dihydrodipicolinate synthase family protein [Globicatella sanguinis]MDK7630496.1 dihydrodipicolinate synthase family protein [Globicatella sanguinis]WIK66233.1 dihydrodipicolinate synthase family protein [Globicatella sanguinis]WKT55638.1 dihydrodipicolinate synthase family protein [Globicatella sanguinis]
MKNLEKYKGIIPAFYACYDDNGDVSPERTQKLAQYYLDKGVKGLYVGGSSGECIYQNIEERKVILENVMEVVGNKMTIIAHVAAPSTRDSIELAKHAANLGVDALAAIPPIYFTLPEYSIEEYWTEMIQAAKIDFIIYNIPQTTGYALTSNLLNKMLENENVIGVKNSSMPVQDILTWKLNSKKDIIVFNGPDEQFVGGRIMGADGGIGGTYGVMPELFLAADKAIQNSNISLATEIQFEITNIIFEMVKAKANIYAIMKKVLEKDGLQLGGVRSPLTNVTDEDLVIVNKISKMITSAINKYC